VLDRTEVHMKFANMLAITSNPYLSMAVWIALLLAALYFARKPFHRAILALSRQFYHVMRWTAKALSVAEQRVLRRNKQLLIAAGLKKAERTAERELFRISASVSRDLQNYPNLHRQVSEIVSELEEDYAHSAEVPPSLPNWIPVIESISKIEPSGGAMVANMLAEINRTLTQQHKTALESFRSSIASRHSGLNKMRPLWRKVTRILASIEKSITSLTQRSRSIDRYMDEYKALRQQTAPAVEALSVSVLSQLFLNGLLLSIATAGAYLYYQLILLPLTPVFGGMEPTVPVRLAALIMVLIALAMGLFLMESMGITRLFPAICGLDNRMRPKLMWIFLAMLTLLAAIAAVLAWLPVSAGIASTSNGADPIGRYVPAIGRMVIGFTLPFVLAFFAIPLEAFMSPFRVLIGWMTAALMCGTGLSLRLIGRLGMSIGRLLISIYDLAIFPALWLENLFIGLKTGADHLKDTKPGNPSVSTDPG